MGGSPISSLSFLPVQPLGNLQATMKTQRRSFLPFWPVLGAGWQLPGHASQESGGHVDSVLSFPPHHAPLHLHPTPSTSTMPPPALQVPQALGHLLPFAFLTLAPGVSTPCL